ncbi:hypothetical protein F5Y17DRAFT_319148 [Xylariaceae sp. FL0594]|nr:hypothetical protein F5Y17DRAFT_319148 [Xylariaceae sp. FL0594]
MGTAAAERVNYATTSLALLILTTRLVLSLCRRERVDASFFLVAASIVGVVVRIVLNAFYLTYGNVPDALLHLGYFDESNLPDIRTGTLLVLAARVLITTVLWLQVSILLLFYSRIIFGFRWVACMVKVAWATVATTYVAVILATFLECRPFSLYWQVRPDPGYCVHAYVQLFVQTGGNILLDLLLIIIAWPIIRTRKRTVAEHVTLYALFVLGTFCIIISIIRLVSVRDSGSSQTIRSLWAAVQMLVSTFVANAPTIYGLIRSMRARRQNSNHRHDQARLHNRHNGSHDIRAGQESDRSGDDNDNTHSGYRPTATGGRTQHPDTIGSWLKMDEDEYLVSSAFAAPAYMLRPLPQATTFFDEETAPAPYSHSSSSAGRTNGISRPE